MNKLYAVKLKKTRVEGKTVDGGHWTGYTHRQIASVIAEKGIGRVESIRHDDKTPKNTRQLKGKEMLEMWKAVGNKNPN